MSLASNMLVYLLVYLLEQAAAGLENIPKVLTRPRNLGGGSYVLTGGNFFDIIVSSQIIYE
jgi:hypothetical protein